MALGAQYAPSMAELIRAAGEAQARGVQQSGQFKANLIANAVPQVLDTFAQGKAQRQADEDRAQKKEQSALATRIANMQLSDAQLDLAIKQTQWLRNEMSKATDQATWTAKRDEGRALGIAADMIPEAYHPANRFSLEKQAEVYEQGFKAEAIERAKRHVVNGNLVTGGGELLFAAPQPRKQHVVDGRVVNEDGTVAYEAPPKPPAEPKSLDEMLVAAQKSGNPQEIQRVLGLMRQRASATQAPSQAQPDYEWVQRGGEWMQIRKGTGQRGDVPQAVAAKEQPPSGPSPYAVERVQRTRQSVGELIGKVSGFNTGFGSLAAAIPGTGARNFRAELDTLKANIAFNELTQMREASKTGGALGAVSEREMALLSSALGALDPGQSPENLQAQLKKIDDSLKRWQDAQAQLQSPVTNGTRATVPGRGAGARVNPFRPK